MYTCGIIILVKKIDPPKETIFSRYEKSLSRERGLNEQWLFVVSNITSNTPNTPVRSVAPVLPELRWEDRVNSRAAASSDMASSCDSLYSPLAPATLDEEEPVALMLVLAALSRSFLYFTISSSNKVSSLGGFGLKLCLRQNRRR